MWIAVGIFLVAVGVCVGIYIVAKWLWKVYKENSNW